jgi:excisionase family DNA binding protein
MCSNRGSQKGRRAMSKSQTDKGQPGPVTDLDALPAILTIEEAAALLRVSVRVSKDLARTGKLPGAFKVGREWRVNRDELLKTIRAGGQDGAQP